MEFMLFILVVFVVYIAAMIGVTNLTMDKLNARSGLFGAGIVNMFTGFIMYNMMKSLEMGMHYGLSPVVLIFLYGFLIMGLSGIVMIAVDLLKAINELSRWVSHMNEKKSAVQNDTSFMRKAPLAPQGRIPTWKRIQMEQEEK